MLTPEQLEMRRAGIGGSDLAGIMGLSPWTTPLDVYLDKIGEAAPVEETPAMYWGTVLESIVADEYAKRTGYKIRRLNKHLQHPSVPVALANIDRQVVSHPNGPGVLECKTAGRKSDGWGEPGTDEIPEYYLTQVTHYLAVTGYKWADLAVLFLGDREFSIYHIPADPELIDSVLTIEREWWEDHVVARVPPAPTSAADLVALWPRDTGAEVLASPAAAESVASLASVRAQIKALKADEEELAFGVKSAIGEASTLVDPSGKPLATWKAAKDSRRTDWKGVGAAFKAAAPAEYEAAVAAATKTVAGSRRLLLK